VRSVDRCICAVSQPQTMNLLCKCTALHISGLRHTAAHSDRACNLTFHKHPHKHNRALDAQPMDAGRLLGVAPQRVWSPNGRPPTVSVGDRWAHHVAARQRVQVWTVSAWHTCFIHHARSRTHLLAHQQTFVRSRTLYVRPQFSAQSPTQPSHALRAHTRPHLITHFPRHVRFHAHAHALHTHAHDRLIAHLPLFSLQVHVSGECHVLQRGAPIPHPWLERPLRPRRQDIRFVGR
jgi:hypothetical protein